MTPVTTSTVVTDCAGRRMRVGSDGRRVSGDKFIVTANGKGCFHPPEQKVYSVVSFIIHHPDLFQEYRPG